MGEMAEMMLDGTLCECCGTFIDFEGGDGFPRYCSPQCARDRGADMLTMTRKERHVALHGERTNCPHCNRRVKAVGLSAHIRALHPEEQGK